MLHITINGRPYQAVPNQTVLDACRENNVFIPTLCHDPRLNPFGSCMICRVEIEGQRGVPLACATAVADGMVITTESEAINAARKTCLELLVSQHYGDCTAPCMLECPAHMDVQGYIAHIANGRYEDAIRLMKETNPLPVVCGRICTRICETKCRRRNLEGTLGIAYLKRFAADIDLAKKPPYLPEVLPSTGKKAAIIGAGPAGLSAAWYLAQKGHAVTIYERQEHPGGMLRYGIPSYRMPRETLDAEIGIIQSLGVEIYYNVDFGKDITVESLKAAGFDAILLAVGSQVGYPLGVAGEENCPHVLRGVDFLGAVTRGVQPDFTGKRIAVVGGGNTAMDCARTSMRLGVERVDLIYRRTVAEMPADDMEIEESQHEGVQFAILTNPIGVSQSGDMVNLELTKMELGEPDASGRRRPQPVAGSEHMVEYDYVISAIGQTQDLSFIGPDCPVETDRWDCLTADRHTMMTSMDGIFAAGDAVSGPQTAILAIAGGKRAAEAMDRYMAGEPIAAISHAMTGPDFYNHVRAKDNADIDVETLADVERVEKVPMPVLTEAQRRNNFNEVELGFSEEEAKREAARCLACGCADVDECKLRQYATVYGADQFALAGDLTIHPIDESHAYIQRDRNKCILCGRCVRICIAAEQGVLGFVGRGFDTTVEPSFSMPLGEEKNCIDCGLCVSTCPVGALTPKADVNLPTTAYLDADGFSITSIADAVAQAKAKRV
ncbi:MAG: FAD-dependent oxidoreductase [Oscillospiraceae bacterium]|nr:FAD-dependent oxidoreductase [Oscillospiraceae bacterium]